MFDSDLEEFTKNFKKAFNDDEFKKWLKKFLLKEAYRVVNRAVKRTPVDTGALRASWAVGSEHKRLFIDETTGKYSSDFNSVFANRTNIDDVEISNGNFIITISNSMEYASFVEYGTAKQRGKFMVSIPIREVANEMPDRFNDAFSKYIKERGF